MTNAAPPIAKFSGLVVEDDPVCAEDVARLVRGEGGAVMTCSTLKEAREAVEQEHFDLVMLDYMLPDGTGKELFHHIRSLGLSPTMIMLTGEPDYPTAVELTRGGLFDYLTKPYSRRDLLSCVRRAVLRLTDLDLDLTFPDFVGRSAAWQEVRRLVRAAAEHPQATVLLTGETGVGKDVTVRMIHQLSFGGEAASHPMVSVNCSTLPAEIIESELFGAEKGAYTGAYQARPGLVAAADAGTLFLDEIGEMPLALQPKLLQLLEARTYRRLGGTEERRFAGRLVAATNRALEQEVIAGRFRADLLYRLDVFRIHLVPLRERREDLAPLTEVLLTKLAEKYERTKPLVRTEDLELLQRYSFPGNARELRNLLERSLLRTPREVNWLELDPVTRRRLTQAGGLAPGFLARAAQGAKGPSAAGPGGPSNGVTSGRELTTAEAREYALIQQVLQEERLTLSAAAERLGMSRATLVRRLEKWPELRRPGPEARPAGS